MSRTKQQLKHHVRGGIEEEGAPLVQHLGNWKPPPPPPNGGGGGDRTGGEGRKESESVAGARP